MSILLVLVIGCVVLYHVYRFFAWTSFVPPAGMIWERIDTENSDYHGGWFNEGLTPLCEIPVSQGAATGEVYYPVRCFSDGRCERRRRGFQSTQFAVDPVGPPFEIGVVRREDERFVPVRIQKTEAHDWGGSIPWV